MPVSYTHLDVYKRQVVISVGNLTVGGTGKTPMVLWIADRLLAEGKTVGILTRGYRGKTVGVSAKTSQTTGRPSVFSTSDEVQLLQSRLGAVSYTHLVAIPDLSLRRPNLSERGQRNLSPDPRRFVS